MCHGPTCHVLVEVSVHHSLTASAVVLFSEQMFLFKSFVNPIGCNHLFYWKLVTAGEPFKFFFVLFFNFIFLYIAWVKPHFLSK